MNANKKFLLISILLFFMNLFILAQEPQGQVISLKEESIITDGQNGVYFRYPHRFNTDRNGNFYLVDFLKIHKFNSNGKIEFSILRTGMGPGEVITRISYIVNKNGIVILQRIPKKIMYFDTYGKFKYEFKIDNNECDDLIGYYKGKYYFWGYEEPVIKAAGKVIETIKNYTLFSMDESTRIIKKNAIFPVKVLAVKYMGARGVVKEPPEKFYIVGKYLYILLSNNYRLFQIDLTNPRKIRKISKNYKKIKRTKENKKYFRLLSFGINERKFTEPSSGYVNDVISLSSSENNLWIITSTKNKDNSIWIDEYDGNNFNSGFWLKMPKDYNAYSLNRQPFIISRGYIYLKVNSSDDNFVIKKFKLVK